MHQDKRKSLPKSDLKAVQNPCTHSPAVRRANNHLLLEGDVETNADHVLSTFMDLKRKILICDLRVGKAQVCACLLPVLMNLNCDRYIFNSYPSIR